MNERFYKNYSVGSFTAIKANYSPVPYLLVPKICYPLEKKTLHNYLYTQ